MKDSKELELFCQNLKSELVKTCKRELEEASKSKNFFVGPIISGVLTSFLDSMAYSMILVTSQVSKEEKENIINFLEKIFTFIATESERTRDLNVSKKDA